MKMANVFAAYIDSSDTWGFQQESYDSQIGFYTNAWVNNSRESTEETTTHPCSYFYQVGKEDEVGFTPTRITINDTNGILTVAGRQKNVASILSKSFRVSSPSPRFFNLRESLRNRRPARIIVSNIVTDSDAELTNIKDYLGLNEEEAEAISRSEEFEAHGGGHGEIVSEEFGAESFNPHVVQMYRKATRWSPERRYRTGSFRTKEEALNYREILREKGVGRFGESLRVVKANRNDPNMETFGKNAQGEYFRDWQAEEFGAEGSEAQRGMKS